MIKLGITGGIGSGKSIVSHLLKAMGVPVYISDIESKRLTANDPYIRQQLINLLGKDIYINDELNKPLLAHYIFSDSAHIQEVNNIIHPRVKEDFRQWVQQHADYDIIAMESAILIESGFADEVDHVVMVYAPLELRIVRAMKRDNCSHDAISQRIRHQMDDEDKRAMANYTIINDDSHPIIPQVNALLEALRTQ